MSRVKPRLAIVQHHAAEGPGELRCWTERRGVEFAVLRADLDQRPPVAASPVVLLGGPFPVNGGPDWLERERLWLKEVLALDAPVLGICLGAQLLADALGAEVRPMGWSETGWTTIQFDNGSSLDMLQWHDDAFELPAGATRRASSAACANQMFSHGTRRIGLQFHPEWNADAVTELNACFGATSPLPRLADHGRFSRAADWLHALLDDWFIGAPA